MLHLTAHDTSSADIVRYNNDWVDSPVAGYTTQLGTGVAVHGNYWSDTLPWPCADYGTIYSISGYSMAPSELDFDGDEQVAVINYPSFDMALNCDVGAGYCSGDTGWIEPSSVSPNVLTAKLWMFIEMWEQ